MVRKGHCLIALKLVVIHSGAGIIFESEQSWCGRRGLGLITLPEVLSLISDMKRGPQLFALIKQPVVFFARVRMLSSGLGLNLIGLIAIHVCIPQIF